jgi:predicted transcriptional regulator
MIRAHGTYRTKDYADYLGIGLNALAHFIHQLEEQRVIRRVGKGRWELVDDVSQSRLV